MLAGHTVQEMTGRPPLAARRGAMPGAPHAFTSPLGLVRVPLTRAHVRLLGPCFKTGRESTRSGSAADWSGQKLSEGTWGQQPAEAPGTWREPRHAGFTPRRACPYNGPGRSRPERPPTRSGRYGSGPLSSLKYDRRGAAGLQPGSRGALDPRASCGSTPGLCPGP